jgi:hypothetical protein
VHAENRERARHGGVRGRTRRRWREAATAGGKAANRWPASWVEHAANAVEKRRHKQKGDAVQSVAGSVDTVNQKEEAANWPPENEAPWTTRSGLVPGEAVSNLGCRPCAIAGMANRCLIGRPGPSISLSK